MSADNAIFIQRRGKYHHVWEGGLSAPEPYIPSGRDHTLCYSQDAAQVYAHSLSEHTGTEYGVIRLNGISALHSLWQRVAAYRWYLVHWWITIRNWYRRCHARLNHR